MNKLIIAVVVLSVLLVILLFRKSYFGASIYTSVSVKIAIRPPGYVGAFTNYAAWITNVDPVAGCPPPIAYGKQLPSLTDKQVPYFAPSSVSCSLGNATAKTCVGTTAGEDTVILTFTGESVKNLLPNQVYVVYLYIKDSLTDKQNYTSFCIKLNNVPPGSPIVATVINSVLVNEPFAQGKSLITTETTLTSSWNIQPPVIQANGYYLITPLTSLNAGYTSIGTSPAINLVAGKQYYVIVSAYAPNSNETRVDGNSLILVGVIQNGVQIPNGTYTPGIDWSVLKKTPTVYSMTVTAPNPLPSSVSGSGINSISPINIYFTGNPIYVKLIDIRQIN
jgi:hypothetical protein